MKTYQHYVPRSGNIDVVGDGTPLPVGRLPSDVVAAGTLPVVDPTTFAPAIRGVQRICQSEESNDFALLFSERFASGLLTFTESGIGTPTVVNGSGRFSYTVGTGGSLQAYQAGIIPRVNYLTISVNVKSMDSVSTVYCDVYCGLTKDFQNWIFATYRNVSGSQKVFIYQKIADAITVLGEVSVTLTTPFKLKLWLAQNSVAVMVDEGSGERMVTQAEIASASIDFRDPAVITAWQPGWGMGSDSAGKVIVLSEFTVRYSGALGVRECYPITWPDGQPLEDESRRAIFFTVDNTGPVTPDSEAPLSRSHWSVRRYDPNNYRFIEETGKIFCKLGGKIFGAQNAKMLYNYVNRSWIVYVPDWGRVVDTNVSPGVDIYYQEVYEDLRYGVHLLDNLTKLILPGINWATASAYDPDVVQLPDGTWLFACTVTTARNSPWNFHTYLFSGTGPTTFTALVGSDLSQQCEGPRFARIGGSLYLINGPLSGVNSVRVYSASASALTFLTALAVPTSSTFFPQQPAIIPVRRGNKTEYQLIALSDHDFISPAGTINTASFGTVVVSSCGEFAGHEFPHRSVRLQR